MGASENKETIRKIYEAMARGDGSVFAASVHPDYVWRLRGQSSWSKRFEGQEEIRSGRDKIAEAVEYGDTDLEERVLRKYEDVVKAYKGAKNP